MTLRSVFTVSLLLSLSLVVQATPLTASSGNTSVTVNNSGGGGAAHGSVLNGSPSRAVLAVDNLYNFWVPIYIEPGGSGVTLTPAAPASGGIYASVGIAGPGARVEWDATFNPRQWDTQAITLTPGIFYNWKDMSGTSVGSPSAALALNALQIICDTAPGFKARSAGGEVALHVPAAVQILEGIPTITDLIRNVGGTQFDLFHFTRDVAQLVTASPEKLSKAASDIGLTVSAKAISRVGTVVGAIDVATTLVDDLRALRAGGAFGQVRFSYAPASLRAAPQPGGVWIAPNNGATAATSIVHFAARVHPGSTVPVSKVDFTAWWPSADHPSISGKWPAACSATAPASSDVYSCDADLSQLGAPPGPVAVSFDMYGSSGAEYSSPNGERQVWYFPTTTVSGLTQVSNGGDFACLLRGVGNVACWGYADDGDLEPPPGPFTQVSSGNTSACALRPGGSVACWGIMVMYAAHGFGDKPPPGAFTEVSVGAGCTYFSCKGHYFFACGLRVGGKVACWGYNSPSLNATWSGGTFAQLSAGTDFVCGLRTTGRVVCWGANSAGQAAPPGGTFKQISAGALSACAVGTGGSIECWGDSYDGELAAPKGNFTQVSVGTGFACGLRTDQTIDCWGSGDYGQPPPSGTFTTVSAGGQDACAVSTGGRAVCWGDCSCGITDHPGPPQAPPTITPPGSATPTPTPVSTAAPTPAPAPTAAPTQPTGNSQSSGVVGTWNQTQGSTEFTTGFSITFGSDGTLTVNAGGSTNYTGTWKTAGSGALQINDPSWTYVQSQIMPYRLSDGNLYLDENNDGNFSRFVRG